MVDHRPVPVVVGTAGHIDHGKSALIEALCGTHPDRWREEKERGITIDLGYAELAWPDGFEVGFVDVPGHEKLVRKMVAGATGMGAAMLVVACDDGVMPQTREHFEVLQLLGVRHGLVALTKADLADAETLELVRTDAEELLAGSAWEEVPILPVSAHSGAGLDVLRAAVRALAEQARAAERADPAAFRLPVQRSFALHGAGTVATGVCASGSVAEGDQVEVQPGGQRSRVRRVHVHGRRAERGVPGLRTAVNLPDLDAEQLPRGRVLCAPGSMLAGRVLRASLQTLPRLPLPKHGSAVLVLAGTAAVEARVFLPPEAERGATGGEGAAGDGAEASAALLVDLELQEPMALVPGQRLLFRRPSPAANLGAGRFLAFGRRRMRRRDAEERAALQALHAALDEPSALVAALLDQPSVGELEVAQIAARLGWRHEAAREVLAEAAAAGGVREMSAGRFLGMGRAGELAREVQGVLGHWRSRHPHRLAIPVARLRERLGKQKMQSLQKLSEEELAVLGLVRRPGLVWGIAEAEPDEDWRIDAERLATRLGDAGLAPPATEELAAETGWDETHVDAVLELLEDRGELVRVEGVLLFARSAVEALRETVVGQLQGDGMDIPAIRDRFGTTRKFLMPLLEFLDERGVTARRGGHRILKDADAPLV